MDEPEHRPAAAGTSKAEAAPLVIANEFAEVLVRRVLTRNGMRLEISSPRTATAVRLDPLELEVLTRQTPEFYSELLEEGT